MSLKVGLSCQLSMLAASLVVLYPYSTLPTTPVTGFRVTAPSLWLWISGALIVCAARFTVKVLVMVSPSGGVKVAVYSPASITVSVLWPSLA